MILLNDTIIDAIKSVQWHQCQCHQFWISFNSVTDVSDWVQNCSCPWKWKASVFITGETSILTASCSFSAFVLKYFQFVPTVCFKIFSLSHSFWHLQIDFSYNGLASFLYFEKLKYTFYIVMEERKTNWL